MSPVSPAPKNKRSKKSNGYLWGAPNWTQLGLNFADPLPDPEVVDTQELVDIDSQEFMADAMLAIDAPPDLNIPHSVVELAGAEALVDTTTVVDEPDMEVDHPDCEIEEPVLLADRTVVESIFEDSSLFEDANKISREIDAEGADPEEIQAAKQALDTGSKSDRASALTRFMTAIGSSNLLSAEEEVALGMRIQAGDRQALEEMVSRNLRLVVNVVKTYANGSTRRLDDLVQEGAIGLMRAAEGFDPTKGWRFSTYAFHWIRQAIQNGVLRRENMIALPTNVTASVARSNRAIREMERSGVGEVAIEKAKREHRQLVRDLTGGHEMLVNQSAEFKSIDATSNGGDPEEDNMPSLGAMIEDQTHNPERRFEIMRTIELMSKSLNAIGSEYERDMYVNDLRPRAPWILVRERRAIERMIASGVDDDKIRFAQEDYAKLVERLTSIGADTNPPNIDDGVDIDKACEDACAVPRYEADTPIGRGRLRFAFELRTGLNDDLEQETLNNIGRMLNVSRENIRQMQEKQYAKFLRELDRQAKGLENLAIDVPKL